MLDKMESFYKKWSKTNKNENRALRNKDKNNSLPNENCALRNNDKNNASPLEESQMEPHIAYKNPSDISYENDTFKLIIQKGFHKRQKNFRLEDHMFYFKIVTKESQEAFPLLSDILDFLHAGFLHLLDNIKQFYEPNNKNIAYLTLFQEPMVNGLNTGTLYLGLALSKVIWLCPCP